MDTAAVKALLDQQAVFLKTTLEQQSEVNNRNLTALANVVAGVQAELARSTAGRAAEKSSKDNVTTRRAFSVLPTYSGKTETFEDWRFQMLQFLGEDTSFTRILDWAETQLGQDEALHEQMVDELDWISADRIQEY